MASHGTNHYPMSTTQQQAALRSTVIWFAPALLLVIALDRMPGGYYDFLRVVVCPLAIVLAFHDYELRGELSGWAIVLALLAVLFNPLLQIHLTREIWAPINLGSALFLVAHYVSCRRLANHAAGQARSRGAVLPAQQPPQPSLKPQRASAPVDADRESHPPADANSLPSNARLNEYQIVRQLGAGGFGITYLAFDHNLNGPVALKEYFYAGLAMRRRDGSVAPSSTQRSGDYEWGRTRFLDEAQVLAGLNHPNIVRVRRFFEANNTAYIVMDRVEGEALSEFLERHGTLTPAQWWLWMNPLLDGLRHVHDANYLHRDIKPDNLMIRADATESEQPVLIDFGAARHAAADKTQNLTAVHTPRYAPIEQYSSTSRQGPYTDIYSLAAVSYRALTGEAPPNAADRVEHDRYRPLVQRLGDPDDHLLAAIDSALAVRAGERPQNVAEWLALIQGPAISGGRKQSAGGSVRPRSTPEQRKLRVRRVGPERETSNGNRYVECDTDAGTVAFWGREKGADNMSLIAAAQTPFTVTCGCIRSNWERHDLWVPENEYTEIEGQTPPVPDALEDEDIPF